MRFLGVAVILLFAAACVGASEFGVGCLGGCVYEPQNVVQLQGCGTVGQMNMVEKGLGLPNFFSCQKITTKEVCLASKSFPDDKPCDWANIPAKFQEEFGVGTCVLKKQKFFAEMGFGVIFEALRKIKAENEGVDIPIGQLQAECLQHSWDRDACEKSQDSKNVPCGWCADLDPDVYKFNPPTTSVCIQQPIAAGACSMLKDDAKHNKCFEKPQTTTPNPSTDKSELTESSEDIRQTSSDSNNSYGSSSSGSSLSSISQSAAIAVLMYSTI